MLGRNDVYRRNAKPADIHIDKPPFWYGWNIMTDIRTVLSGLFSGLIVILLVVLLLAAPILGGGAALQWVVTNLVGHPVGTYPAYCIIIGLYMICNAKIEKKIEK